MNDKKSISSIVMASLGKKPEDEMDQAPSENPMDMIAKDAMSAIKSSDAMAFTDAMKAMFDHFQSEPPIEEEME